MKKIFIAILLTAFLFSCSNDENLHVTKQQELVMDTLSKAFSSNISIGTSKDFLRFSKPYDLEISFEGRSIREDSLPIIAKIASEKVYATLLKREKYKSIVVKFVAATNGNAEVRNEMSFNFDLTNVK